MLFSPVLKARTHGYDVTDYYTIDNRVGTNDEFKAAVRLFRENGIRVVLDSVFNHCGRDFFAFKELQKGNREYANRFSGVNFERHSPLGDPFTYDTWAGHYELVKFNLKNPDTRDYLLKAAEFWINEFDIDGMRLDAADVLDFDFMSELRRVTTRLKPDFWLMGEVVHGDYSGWVNDGALQSATNYMLFKSLFSSHNDRNLYELAHSVKSAVPECGLPLYNFLDNHDQPRIASAIQNKAHLATLYALLFALPGVPSIYYGSEWGIKGEKAGNSDAPLRPYIDIENPIKDMPYLEEFIQKLAQIRQSSPALKYGGYNQVSLEYRKPFVFERNYRGERVFVAVNIEDSREMINLSAHCGGILVDLLSQESFEQSSAITIEPHSARILTCRG